MGLKLRSTFPDLDNAISEIDNDQRVDMVEFQNLRDKADEQLGALTALDAGAFQAAADALVEAMQKLAIAARKAKISQADRTRLKEGVEYQVAYVVAGYQTSIHRL